MKHIDAAWIEQILIFDDESEVEPYLQELEAKKTTYAIVERYGTKLRIRKQYNRNYFPRKGVL